MPLAHVSTRDDPRLEPYLALKDRELARDGNCFVAEGEQLVRRLLASDFMTLSVLLAERRLDEMRSVIPDGVTTLVVPDRLIHEVIGYKFHSGVIACGQRKPPLALDALLAGKNRFTVVVLPETANAENLGGLIRISAAFGADAMLLGERCCDPFWRQSIRVSMGSVFRLPIVQSKNLASDLTLLAEHYDAQVVATVLDESAEPLHAYRRPDRIAILFGNEAQGLGEPELRLAHSRITIPMQLGTDSLNVAVSAGIVLYQLTQ